MNVVSREAIVTVHLDLRELVNLAIPALEARLGFKPGSNSQAQLRPDVELGVVEVMLRGPVRNDDEPDDDDGTSSRTAQLR